MGPEGFCLGAFDDQVFNGVGVAAVMTVWSMIYSHYEEGLCCRQNSVGDFQLRSPSCLEPRAGG